MNLTGNCGSRAASSSAWRRIAGLSLTLCSVSITGIPISSAAITMNSLISPMINASASRDRSGRIHITLCQMDTRRPAVLVCDLQGASPRAATGRILTAADINAHNTFEAPDALCPAALESFDLEGSTLRVELPPSSVAVLSIE